MIVLGFIIADMLDIFCCSKCRRRKETRSVEQSTEHPLRHTDTSPDFLTDSEKNISSHGTEENAPRIPTDCAGAADGQNSPNSHHKNGKRPGLSNTSLSPFQKRLGEQSSYCVEEESKERSKQLRQVLETRKQEGLRVDQITSLDGYDTDAEVIQTPAASQKQSTVNLGDSAGDAFEARLQRRSSEVSPKTKEETDNGSSTEMQQLSQDERARISASRLSVASGMLFDFSFQVPTRSTDTPEYTDPFEHDRIHVRKPLPKDNVYDPKLAKTHAQIQQARIQAAGQLKSCNIGRIILGLEAAARNEMQSAPEADRETHKSQQGNALNKISDNLPQATDALAAVVIPPKSPSRSASNHSQSEATRRQLRVSSSGQCSGDSGFRYTGTFRPQASPKLDFDALKAKNAKSSKESKFREEFGFSKPPSAGSHLDGNEDRPRSLAPSLRKQPREPTIMPGGEEAAAIWERALQFHAREAANRRLSPRSSFREGTWSASRPDPKRSHSDRPDLVPAKRRRILTIDSTEIAPEVMVPDAASQRLLLQDRPEGTWARYPSHTRSERAESAGVSDCVSTHDFAKLHELARTASMVERTRKKQKPLPGSRNFFDIIKDRWNNESHDPLRMEKGFRSSVSTGGELKHPDLELLPKMDPVYTPRSVRTTSSNYFSSSPSSEENLLNTSGHSTGSSPNAATFPRSARAWSKAYQDNIPSGPFSREIQQQEATHSSGHDNRFLSPDYVPRKPSKALVLPVVRPTSSDSALDVRKSTVDFSETLREKEEQSRKSLLENVGKMDSTKEEKCLAADGGIDFG